MFGQYISAEQQFEAVVITGDIGEAVNVGWYLNSFSKGIPCPVYFTLGNHDYYGGNFEQVRKNVSRVVNEHLVWLDRSPPILLDTQTALIGHEGWYDARLGNPETSDVILSDFRLIKDLKSSFKSKWVYKRQKENLREKLRLLGQQAADDVEPKLIQALQLRETVIFVTHVPPFAGATWHEGNLSNGNWLPWFSCDVMGKMLLRVAEEYKNKRILVLCGHTHSPGEYQPLPNLKVLTGKAVYGAPDISEVISIPLKPFSDHV